MWSRQLLSQTNVQEKVKRKQTWEGAKVNENFEMSNTWENDLNGKEERENESEEKLLKVVIFYEIWK